MVESATDPLEADTLTAGADSIPRRHGSKLTLSDCGRAFLRRRSPPLLLAALAAAIAVRALLGSLSWRDAVMAGLLIAATPPVEWLIHVYLLHARPLRWRGRTIELLATREHRWHHERPSILAGVLIPPYAVAIFLVQIAVTNYLVSFPIQLVLRGDRLALAATGTVVSFAILALYEWCHFLIHTPYRPRGRYYRSIWRAHRLHHFKNEHYWFGVTSTVGDRLLGTAPDQRTVERSPTARNLHA